MLSSHRCGQHHHEQSELKPKGIAATDAHAAGGLVAPLGRL